MRMLLSSTSSIGAPWHWRQHGNGRKRRWFGHLSPAVTRAMEQGPPLPADRRHIETENDDHIARAGRLFPGFASGDNDQCLIHRQVFCPIKVWSSQQRCLLVAM